MDRPNNGAYGRTQNVPSGRALEGRSSVESQGSRLQKKRSNPGVRPEIRNASQSLPAARGYGKGGASGVRPEQPRKGSLRNVVRKIFGRRSKEVEPQPLQRSPPRHKYHASEPTPSALVPQVEEAEPEDEEHHVPHRTASVPIQQLSSPGLQRVRSPYAVEFPRSARLKPLNLGDPFYAPGSQLRRRKTMPSLLVAEDEAAAVAASVDDQPIPSFETVRDAPTPDAERTMTIRSAKRRSRSADDLKRAVTERSPPRKRSDEIRFWRDSFQGSVLRASGFVSKVPREASPEEHAEVETPTAKTDDPFVTRQSRIGTFRSSPPMQHGPSLSETEVRSTATYGTELSKDLEDRVARLEAGLHTFQTSLAHMTAERNRRTVLVDGVPQRRSSVDARTPSMLADTLSGFMNYQFAAPQTERPSTSPQPPRTPDRSSPSARRTPVPTLRPAAPPARPLTTPTPPLMTSMTAANPGGNGNGNGATTQPQPYTFRSLYEMLTDERSARRRLETQLRGMRQEITDLQYQVSVNSGIQSQRSSFVPLDPLVGSSVRLRELLRQTENSPPGTADAHQRQPQQQIRDSGETGLTSSTGNQAGMVSRFSGSDSEAGATARSDEELTTPYEAYQTPREDRRGYPFGGGGGDTQSLDSEGEMF